MKYFIQEKKIIEDNELMSGKSLSQMSKLTGKSISLLSFIKSGKRTITEESYRYLKSKLSA